MTDWQEVLQAAGFPTTAIVLDFETYFDTDYTLKKMSTVEFVCDERFEVTGLGVRWLQEGFDSGDVFFTPSETTSFCKSEKEKLQSKVTIVGQNNKFDHLILREHFGITPKFTVDLIDLDRQWDASAKHSLEAMVKHWGAPTSKGDTNRFKGYHYKDLVNLVRKAKTGWGQPFIEQVEKTTPSVQELEEYCKNDIDIESFLFQKLLPLVTVRPEIELPLMAQTLKLFLIPSIVIDMSLGEELKSKMQQEIISSLEKVDWVLNYAN